MKDTLELPDSKVDDQLSKEVVNVANKVDEHLSELEKIIKDGSADKDISKKHKELEAEVTALLGKVTDEHTLTDEARVAMHGLEERIVNSKETAVKAKDESFENSTMAKKVQIMVEKYKLPASLSVAVLKGLWEVSHEVKKGKGFFGKIWGFIKGVGSGIIRGGLTYLGATAVDFVAGLIDGLDPRNRAKNAKDEVAGRWNNLFKKTGERYDPKNQGVQDERNDSDPEKSGYEGTELRMDELNRPVFGRKDGRTELAVLPNDITNSSVYKKDQVDLLYNDPQFTDKYLLFTTTVNMRTQAARTKDQAGGILSTKDSEIGSIQLREQELLDIEKEVQAGAPKEKVLADIKNTLLQIQQFEQKQKYVIGTEWWNIVMPTINDYTTNTDTRAKDYEDAQLKIYDGFRKVGGITQGNSEVVKNRLYEDLLHTAKYEKLDGLFDESGEKIFDILGKIDPESKSDEEISSLVGKHLLACGFLENAVEKKRGVPESVISEVTKSIISTYRSAQKNINDNQGEFKKYFTRAYGLEIESDKKQQQKMISAYEQMYGAENLQEYAQKKSLTYSDENKWTVVRDFAWELVKKNSLHGAVLSAYHDIFFDKYLPTQSTGKATRGPSFSLDYDDKKEDMLSSVIGAGNEISDNTLNSAVNVGINIAASLIPVVGAEFVAARLAGGLIASEIMVEGTMSARIAMFGIRAVLGHVAMTTFTGIANEKSASEIFDNLTDWREFAQNAIFFNVIGQVGPWITKNIGRIPKLGKVSAENLQKLSTHRAGRLALMTGTGVVEAGIIESARGICDPNFEWNWGEVMTVLMLSTIMAGKIGAKAKEYTATKTPEGKIKLVPNSTLPSTLRVAAKVESAQTAGRTLRAKCEERLAAANDGEVLIMGETVTKKTINSVSSYTVKGEHTSFTSIQEVVSDLKIVHFGSSKPTYEQVGKLRTEELEGHIEKMVNNGKTFSKGNDTYKFQIDKKGIAQVMKKTPKGFIQLTEQEALALSNVNEQLLTNTTKKFFEKITGNKKTMKELFDSGKISKEEFGARCKDHEISFVENMLVGDFFKLIGEGKVGKLLFGGLTKFRGLTYTEALIPTRTARRIYLLGKNSTTLFNIGSIVYGDKVGDNGDAGADEALENYLLYSVIGRGFIGKIALAAFDYSDILI